MRRIMIFDTTLRDGEQSPGASLNLKEKLQIARQLELLKVDVIEAGFPITSTGDFEAVQAVSESVRGPIICGLARTVEADIERAWQALRKAARPRIHLFCATSEIHRKYKLHKAKPEILRIAVASVRQAKRHCPDVEFSPEDASRTEPQFLAEVVTAVIEAGATTVNIPDTVGYAMPEHFSELIRHLRKHVPNIHAATISVHCHNDLGLAVANSLAAVQAGADQVECTINGLGERARQCGARGDRHGHQDAPRSLPGRDGNRHPPPAGHKPDGRARSPACRCSATRRSSAKTRSRTKPESTRTAS